MIAERAERSAPPPVYNPCSAAERRGAGEGLRAAISRRSWRRSRRPGGRAALDAGLRDRCASPPISTGATRPSLSRHVDPAIRGPEPRAGGCRCRGRGPGVLGGAAGASRGGARPGPRHAHRPRRHGDDAAGRRRVRGLGGRADQRRRDGASRTCYRPRAPAAGRRAPGRTRQAAVRGSYAIEAAVNARPTARLPLACSAMPSDVATRAFLPCSRTGDAWAAMPSGYGARLLWILRRRPAHG